MDQSRTGAGWTVGNIFSSLRELGLSPTMIEPDADDPFRLIALYDPASTLKFGCLYEPGAGDHVQMIGLLCILPAPQMSVDDVMAIDRRLTMATAMLQDGHLWIYAELNIAPTFSHALFDAQMNFYLADMRTALQMMMMGDAMTYKAAEAMKRISKSRGLKSPMVSALTNKGQERPSLASPRAAMAAAQEVKSSLRPASHCPKCKGSGRGLFGRCRHCDGTGLVR
ncbi:MAG: hypothetical protein AAF830_11360 [Pseudomonadota bacterium]